VKNIILFGIILLSLVFARRDCLQQAELDPLGRSSRPVKHTFTISPSGHFFIHFDTTGTAAPDLTDSDSNGVPDYIDEVGIIADSAHHVLVDIMEWEEEPFDGEGGYDIFIENYASGVYGYNTTDTPSLNSDGQTSYLQIDNDYLGFNSIFNLSSSKIMQISVAHEYFHGLQWGYRKNTYGSKYFYEMTSMWFEDILIPDGNDYLDGWADDLLHNPTSDFDNTGSGYELALFGHYLSSFLDPKGITTAKNSTIIREIWENFKSNSTSPSAFDTIQSLLENQYNISFTEVWVDFISRNLFNGINDNFYYYGDQALIDPINTNTQSLDEPKSFTLQLDNESAAIESFHIGDLESLITIKQGIENFIGRVAIVSTDNSEFNNLFWGSDSTLEESFYNAEVHFVYGIDSSPIALPIEITAHTVPLPPSNLMAVAAQDSIILSWNPSPGPGDTLSYVIFRDNNSDEDGITLTINIPGYNDTNYVDQQNIKGGQSYTYKVACRNGVGESSASNTISVTSWPYKENVLKSEIIKIYPNPIRQSQELTILYTLDSYYLNPIVDLISIKGEVVTSIKLASFAQGWHRENINSILKNNPSNGVYFIRLQPDQKSTQTITEKITIIN